MQSEQEVQSLKQQVHALQKVSQECMFMEEYRRARIHAESEESVGFSRHWPMRNRSGRIFTRAWKKRCVLLLLQHCINNNVPLTFVCCRSRSEQLPWEQEQRTRFFLKLMCVNPLTTSPIFKRTKSAQRLKESSKQKSVIWLGQFGGATENKILTFSLCSKNKWRKKMNWYKYCWVCWKFH